MAFGFTMAVLEVFRRTNREGRFSMEKQLCHVETDKPNTSLNDTNTEICFGTIFKNMSTEQRQK